MWTNKNFDSLLTFSEWIDEYGSESLYEGLKIEDDDVTQSALYEWFFYRKVVDNDRFLRYFRRAIDRFENQYYNLIRVETTDIDPLVGNYLERQIVRMGTRTENGTDTSTESGNYRNTNVNSGTAGGTSKTTTEGTANSTGNSNASTTENGTTSGTSNTNTKSKHGETPQAAVGSGSGMALDWTYLSSQDESESDNTTAGTTSGTTSTTGSTTDNSKTTGVANTTTTNTNSGESTSTGNDSKTKSGSLNKNENSADDTRERLTGRQEAPQDLLGRARDYITRTNAFIWLTDQLDDCFMQIMEM